MNTDDFFHALTSPYRREILSLLKSSDLSAGEIAAHFDVSQPSISRHLDVLKRAGLVNSVRSENKIIYSLNVSAATEGTARLNEIFK